MKFKKKPPLNGQVEKQLEAEPQSQIPANPSSPFRATLSLLIQPQGPHANTVSSSSINIYIRPTSGCCVFLLFDFCCLLCLAAHAAFRPSVRQRKWGVREEWGGEKRMSFGQNTKHCEAVVRREEGKARGEKYPFIKKHRIGKLNIDQKASHRKRAFVASGRQR